MYIYRYNDSFSRSLAVCFCIPLSILCLSPYVAHSQTPYSICKQPYFFILPGMMMIAFITIKSSLVPLIEGLWAQI